MVPLIKISDEARTQLLQVLEKQNKPDGALRVYVSPGGCSGFSYGMSLEDEIDRLTEAFELGELPFPRTDENVARFKARVEELRKTQSAAQIALQKRRDSNHVTAE